MRKVDMSVISTDECMSVQINGLSFCENCKFTGLTACNGKNIKKTGKNSRGVEIGYKGIAK